MGFFETEVVATVCSWKLSDSEIIQIPSGPQVHVQITEPLPAVWEVFTELKVLRVGVALNYEVKDFTWSMYKLI